MSLTIDRGIFPKLMKDFKAAAETGGRISAAEVKKTVTKGMNQIKAEYEGADSERGLAAARNALAKTVRAADKNWNLTGAAYREAKELLGANLDGKAGKLADLEKKIRNTVRSATVSPYGG